VLGGILTVAAAQGGALRGALLLFIYQRLLAPLLREISRFTPPI